MDIRIRLLLNAGPTQRLLPGLLGFGENWAKFQPGGKHLCRQWPPMAANGRQWPPMAANEILGTIGVGSANGRQWPPMAANEGKSDKTCFSNGSWVFPIWTLCPVPKS